MNTVGWVSSKRLVQRWPVLVAAVLSLLVVTCAAVPVEAASPTTELVSRTSAGPKANGHSSNPSVSADGRFVAFRSRAENLPGGDGATSHVYVRDAQSGTTALVSRTSSGPKANGDSFSPSISGDGRFVAFASEAANLPGGDGDTAHVYIHDRQSGTTALVSRTSAGLRANGGNSFDPSVSADGRFVAFRSEAANLPGGDGATSRVYVHDRQSGTTALVSRTSAGPKANGRSSFASVSADGRFVAFVSQAANLPGGDGAESRIYVHDRQSGTTALASRTSAGPKANGESFFPAISADGRFVAFRSRAENLPGGDGATRRIYVHDRQAGTTTLVSRTSAGPKANGPSSFASVSADGRFVAFGSQAENLPGGDGATSHVYVHDRQSGTTALVSRTSAGPKANAPSFTPSVSADGRFVAFESRSANLPGGDGGIFHIYRRGPL